ncbi:LytTR family DNA-binding domain-containing protein [soil metagenome]
MKIKCVITDDEPVARKGIQGYIEKISFLELVGVCENAMVLNDLLKVKEVDLLFLDIEMPYMNGVELLQSLTKRPKIIFTTAYEKYALQGFELEAIDFLLKPISFERFLKAANKAHELFRNSEGGTTGQDFVFVKSENKLVRIQWDEVYYIKAMENYVCLHTKSKRYIIHATMKSVAESISSVKFLQVHKSYIIQTSKITGINGNVIELDAFQIPVSRNYKDGLMDKVVNNNFLR